MTPRSVSAIASLAVGYALLGAIGLSLAVPPGYASPVFPAAGLALAVVLRSGPGLLPGVWLGSFCLNAGLALHHGALEPATTLASIGIATGATVQAGLGYLLLRRQWAACRGQLITERDTLGFLALGGPVACLASATIGSFSLVSAQIIDAAALGYSWWAWYVGDTLGVLLFTPLSLAALYRRRPLWRERLRLIGSTMAIALFVAGALFLAVAHWEHERQFLELAAHGEEISRKIDASISAHDEILAGLAGLFEISPDLGQDAFDHFTQGTLHTHPDLSALSFNELVPNRDREAFEAQMSRSRTREAFRIVERNREGQLVPAAIRDDYVVVKFIAPLSGNKAAIGFDIASEPQRFDAVHRARDTGRTAMTGPLRLVQEHQEHVGVLLLRPIFDVNRMTGGGERLKGFAVAVVRVGQLADLALRGRVPPGLVVHLDDLSAKGPRSALYRSHSEVAAVSDRLSWQQDMSVADRTWRLSVIATEAYLQQNRPWLAWIAGVGGLIIATLLQILLMGITGRASLIRKRVDAQTVELRERGRLLEDSERRHRSVVDSVKEVIFQANLDGRWTFLNPAWKEITGFAVEDSVGHRVVEFLPLEARKQWEDMHTDLAQGLKPDCRQQFRLTTRDGSARWLEAYARATLGSDGRVIGISGTLDDVTARLAVEAELATYRDHLEKLVELRSNELQKTEARAMHILQASADGLYGVDIEGRITFINRAACHMLGLDEAQAIGQRAHDLFHHSRADGSHRDHCTCPAYHAMRTGQPYREEDDLYWHADGHPIPITYAIYPLRIAGELTGSVVSFVDMSARRAAALAREEALAAAEHLARMRAEFLANMSHEIRTPLHAILGFSAVGARHVTNPERVRELLAKINRSGRLLMSVVNDILDFAAIEAGKLRVECRPIEAGSLLDDAIEMLGDKAHAKGLSLEARKPGQPAICLADPLRLSQILMNLLSNAVKFTEEGGITATCEIVDDRVVLTVADTGIGMTDEEAQRAFMPFEQVDGSATRRASGTGLGLAISRNLAELMGGTLGVTSRPGAGSRFVLALPVPPIDRALPTPQASTTAE